MFFKYSFKNINHLLLIPALWLAYDFLPLWYLYIVSGLLIVITFIRLHYLMSYFSFFIVYEIFQTVGRQIIPETMVPILAAFLLAQLIYNRWKERDESFVFFLWIGIFAVFSASFTYLLYSVTTLTYFFLQQSRNESLNFKEIIKTFYNQRYQLIFTAILASLMFVFFPRFYNFLPSANYKTKGEIGYKSDIENSTSGDLNLSNKTAFFAETEQEIFQELLYWRGSVNSYTDGYNWKSINLPPTKGPSVDFTPQKTFTLGMKYEIDLDGDLVLLDRPLKISETNFRSYKIEQTNEFKFYRKKKKSSLVAISSFEKPDLKIHSDKYQKYYLQLPKFVPNIVKELATKLAAPNLSILTQNFKMFLIKEEFSYTLKPGPLPTLKSFIEAKKGFCTHYASLLGIIYRLNGYPARLISGFQGGLYNQYGKYYEVSSNDAHAWVEVFNGRYWMRVDPTGFISPNRINFGGEQFLSRPDQILVKGEDRNYFQRVFYDIKLQWDNLNYKVSIFFDNFDREKQKDLSSLLKIDLKTFFILGGIFIAIAISLFIFITQFRKKIILHPSDIILKKLSKKLKIHPSLETLQTIEQKRKALLLNPRKYDSKVLEEILLLYQESKYSSQADLNEFKQKVSHL